MGPEIDKWKDRGLIFLKRHILLNELLVEARCSRLLCLAAKDEFKNTHPAWKIAFAYLKQPRQRQPVFGKSLAVGLAIACQSVSHLQRLLEATACRTQLNFELARLV